MDVRFCSTVFVYKGRHCIPIRNHPSHSKSSNSYTSFSFSLVNLFELRYMRTKAAPTVAIAQYYYRGKGSYSRSGNRSQNDVVEEIEGVIRVYRDGHVERPQIVPCVPASWCPPDLNLTCTDIPIDAFTATWARLYVPNNKQKKKKLPIMIYFHGGGFCVGSASWLCYHHFLCNLCSIAQCVILSLNYRLAPEHPLPAAYEDGLNCLMWLQRQSQAQQWWTTQCDFSRIFLAGDSAGANIAYHVAPTTTAPPSGLILIQPFFGGEARTASEWRCNSNSNSSALSLGAADAYWRMALPRGATRDHKWCNPVGSGTGVGVGRVMVCVSELDILRDRNVELCRVLGAGGKKVKEIECKGVGHAFQILGKTQPEQALTFEMMARINSFLAATVSSSPQ